MYEDRPFADRDPRMPDIWSALGPAPACASMLLRALFVFAAGVRFVGVGVCYCLCARAWPAFAPARVSAPMFTPASG
eukprot:10183230-Alexandrium_andersonii.AAC.1